MMKAVALLDAGHARVVDIAQPSSHEGELLLRVEMIGLCGSDLNSYRGKNPLVTFPRIIGHEIAATVVEGDANIPSGSRVTVSPYTACGRCASCLRGRRNACQNNQTLGVQRDGALTEFISVPASNVYPADLRFEELCLVEPLTVGVHAVSRGRITATDTVVVFGCGGVGLGAVAGSAFRGARTIAVDLEDSKLETARLAGATETINSKREDFSEAIKALNDGRGPDVVIEAIGSPDLFRAAVELVSFTGRVVYIGYTKEPVPYDTKYFVQKELDILGSRNALPEDFREVIALMKSGSFPVDQTISAIVGIEEAPSILRHWSDSPSAFTKIMVRPNA